MIFVLEIAFLALLPFLFRIKYRLELSCLILFVFLALRFDYGNDYINYSKLFYQLIIETPVDEIIFDTQMEKGFLWLNILFIPFGFFALVACLTGFNIYSIYFLIKKYVEEKYHWYALLIYIFTFQLMLIHASALRQTLAFNFEIWAIYWILRRKILWSYIFFLLAIQVHRSAVILLLLPLLYNKTVMTLIVRFYPIILAGTFVVGLYIAPLLSKYVAKISPRYAFYFEQIEAGQVSSGLGLLGMMIILGMLYWLLKYVSEMELRFLLILNLLGFCVTLLAIQMLILSRFMFYFEPFAIVTYPLFLSRIKNRLVRIGFLGVTSFIISYSFYNFFQSEVWIDKFGRYQTIFSEKALDYREGIMISEE